MKPRMTRLAAEIALLTKGDISYLSHEYNLNQLARSILRVPGDLFSRQSISHFLDCTRNLDAEKLMVLSKYTGYPIEALNERYFMYEPGTEKNVGGPTPIIRGTGQKIYGEYGSVIVDYKIKPRV